MFLSAWLSVALLSHIGASALETPVQPSFPTQWKATLGTNAQVLARGMAWLASLRPDVKCMQGPALLN